MKKQYKITGIVNGKLHKVNLPFDKLEVNGDTIVVCQCEGRGCLDDMETESFDTEYTSVHQWLCPNCGELLVEEYT